MPPTRRELLAATGSCIVLAGCSGDGDSTDSPADGGDGGDGGDGNADPTPTPTAMDGSTATTGGTDGDAATVQVRSHAELGEILVDAEGMALYMFDSDERGSGESTCSGGCADAWPPLTVEDDPAAGEDVTADLSTFEREDGTTQVAAGGWPLYYFADDGQVGDATGQGANDVWWVLRPDGTPVRSSGTPAGTATATPTGEGAAQVVDVAPGGDLVFDPETFEVAAGDTVRWVWRGDGHNVRADETPADSDWRGTPGDALYDEGHEYAHTFDVAGDYTYFCVPHEDLGMTGSFTVTE